MARAAFRGRANANRNLNQHQRRNNMWLTIDLIIFLLGAVAMAYGVVTDGAIIGVAIMLGAAMSDMIRFLV